MLRRIHTFKPIVKPNHRTHKFSKSFDVQNVASGLPDIRNSRNCGDNDNSSRIYSIRFHIPKNDREELKDVGLTGSEKIDFYRGKGCAKCMNTGYKGRIGIYELMSFDDNIRNLIVAKVPAEEIKKKAVESGMIALKDDGIEKVKAGLTTVEEVLRATQEE